MRRGHSGIGGWRGENPRHFRPRSGGAPHFRPSRNYGMPEISRFPPPGPRMHRPARFTRVDRLDDDRSSHYGRNKYRSGGHHNTPARSQDRGHHRDKSGSRQILPLIQHKNVHSSYPNSSNYYVDKNKMEQYTVNSMGDVDHRQNMTPHATFGHQQPISPWAHTLNDNKRHNYEDRSPQKTYRHYDSGEPIRIPILDHPGHRPPSSDHYGGTPSSATTNNNTSFSRSVDDTVDIVRKRLMNRNEPQQVSVEQTVDQSNSREVRDMNSSYQNVQQDQPTKKRIQRHRQDAKSNCDKMKNNIVHQLFKMDKDKIHKLMDNPNSSTKFEYAISSLITESQNSFNRHLRSVAEKSLCSSSADFIHDDNNTIYEDTFMKQMQCILDPQDTVLLEDIKPLVMAELSKVLQLDNVDQIYDIVETEDHVNFLPRDEHLDYQHYNEQYNYEDYSQERYYDHESRSSNTENPYHNTDNLVSIEPDLNYEINQNTQGVDIKPVFERWSQQKGNDYEEKRRQSSESRQSRKSIDNKSSEDLFKLSPEQLPLFDSNVEQFSEEEDPFAELDKQYHVAVDPNFSEPDLYYSPQQDASGSRTPNYQKEMSTMPCEIQIPNINTHDIKKEIEDELKDIAKSPLKLTITSRTTSGFTKLSKSNEIKSKVSHALNLTDPSKENILTQIISEPKNEINVLKNIDVKQEKVNKPKEIEKKKPGKSEDSSNVVKSSMSTNSRKRSIDQRPSHRKEKRKKTESSPSDNKQILNKNIIINVNDCASKNAEKCGEAAKSIFNLYFSKGDGKDVSKDSKKVESPDKSYSDKYVKRKEPQKKLKEKEPDPPKKRNSNSTSHSGLNPKESVASTGGQTPTNSDTKTKLKTIDMFMDVPRKVNLHQAHRNTAPAPDAIKSLEENKAKQSIALTVGKDTRPNKKLISKETQTFESKCSTSRFCQTEIIRLVSSMTQTDPVSLDNSKPKSTDTFERMKEIDLEIQALIQEKFKLYSSLESKDSCQSTMQTLGMSVLNVTPFDESKQDDENGVENPMTEDTIVDDFTNIPVEELEQIAFESVQEEKQTLKPDKRVRRYTQKLLESQCTSSATTLVKRNKKDKTPNISLIEQIITDDRPLEDIILLDELEHPPLKGKRRSRKLQPKKRAYIKSIKNTKPNANQISYDLKECSVVLLREDFSSFLNVEETNEENDSTFTPFLVPTSENRMIGHNTLELDTTARDLASHQELTEILEESVENDLQFDMLDVSEDIVIGDNCEVKSRDKDLNERIDVPISEEIILDNSQTSLEYVYTPDVTQGEIECKMYDYSTDENLRRDSTTVSGNADAVLAIECIENNFIAACLDGNVYHFSGDGLLLNTLRGSNLAVTCLTIVKEKYGTTVYTGSLDSRIRYYDLDTGVEKGPECNVLSPIQTMDRAWDTVFVGTRTGFVLQFECKNNMLIPVSTVKFSEQSILALRAMKEGPRKVLLVAARSENVTVKDAQTGLLLRTLVGPKMTVYTLLFEDGKVYCGTSSHQIHVFDYASGGHVGVHEGGKGAVCLRATGGLVFAGCYDGCVYVYREGETRPLAQLRGPGLMLLSLAVLGTKIVAGYKDRSLYIWKIPLSILQEMIL